MVLQACYSIKLGLEELAFLKHPQSNVSSSLFFGVTKEKPEDFKP
jgi:hypothetical protein